MDVYPLNLILAVFTASATIFLGFLPTKNIKSTFFAEHTILACFAWALVAVTVPHKIAHYPLALAFFCFASWWNFRKDRALAGKMWLSVASGLGISTGVIFILAVNPQANPPGLPELNETLLLASIYLGGAIIGLAYVCFALIQGANTSSGVTHGVVQRYVGLLFGLIIVRAAALGGSAFFSLKFGLKPPPPDLDLGYLLLCLGILILPGLAFLAHRAAGFSSRIQPTKYLIAIFLLSLLTEILARLLVL